ISFGALFVFVIYLLISILFALKSNIKNKEWYLIFYLIMNLLVGSVLVENIIFTILINVFVCYFAFFDKKLILDNQKSIIYTFFIILAYGIMILSTKSSPLYLLNDWVDTQSYYTMGKGIFNGKAIYKDLFEQKGPLFYLIYGFGYLINTHNLYGVYFIEGIVASIVFIYTYKIASMYLSKEMSIVTVCLLPIIIYNKNFMRYGGSCEEFMIPIILMSFYYFIKSFRCECKDSKYMLINGVLGSCVFMMKFNVSIFFIGLGLFVFIMNIYKKNYKALIKNICMVIAGAFIVILPIIIWLNISGSLKGFLEVIEFNSKYSPIKLNIDGIHKTIRNILNGWSNNWFCTTVIIGGISMFIFNRKFVNIFGALGLLLSFVLINYGVFASSSQPYYYMIISSFSVFGVIGFLYFAQNNNLTIKKSAVPVLAVLSIVLTTHYNNNFYETKPFINYVSAQDKFAMIMKSKSNNPTLLNYNFLDGGFYTAADIVPNTRFFQKQNISNDVYPLNIQTQLNAMSSKNVEFVVVRRGKNEGAETERVLTNNYNLISTHNQKFEGIDFTYYLYEAKK
ncbi:MAG: glycosyltransferase family 39 protein, partial [Lachnospirales bacterium]